MKTKINQAEELLKQVKPQSEAEKINKAIALILIDLTTWTKAIACRIKILDEKMPAINK